MEKQTITSLIEKLENIHASEFRNSNIFIKLSTRSPKDSKLFKFREK